MKVKPNKRFGIFPHLDISLIKLSNSSSGRNTRSRAERVTNLDAGKVRHREACFSEKHTIHKEITAFREEQPISAHCDAFNVAATQ